MPSSHLSIACFLAISSCCSLAISSAGVSAGAYAGKSGCCSGTPGWPPIRPGGGWEKSDGVIYNVDTTMWSINMLHVTDRWEKVTLCDRSHSTNNLCKFSLSNMWRKWTILKCIFQKNSSKMHHECEKHCNQAQIWEKYIDILCHFCFCHKCHFPSLRMYNY